MPSPPILKTSDVPGRGFQGNRVSSPHPTAAQLPSRALLLEHMHPFDYKVYEPVDIEPYLI
jgi:hypothetical protein